MKFLKYFCKTILGNDPQKAQASGTSIPVATLSTPAVTASPKRRHRARTGFGVNTIKSLLEVFGSLSNNVPVPGLKPASELLLRLIEGIQDTKENALGFQKLAERIESLNGLVLYAVQNEGNMSQTLSFFQRLERELDSVREDIAEALNQGRLTMFLNSRDDKLSLASHITSLDSIIVDFSLAVGVDIKTSITRMLFLISQMREMMGKVPNIPKSADPPSWMNSRLRRQFYSGNIWEEIDSDGIRRGVVYTASFASDSTSCTTYQLEVVSNQLAKWTICAPTSAWYPGVHSGTLSLPGDFPFKPPELSFESLLFSPNVGGSGQISAALLRDYWAPKYSLKDVMDLVAFMLVIEPTPTALWDERLPGIPLWIENHGTSAHEYVTARGRDAFMQATNFFARVYSQGEVELMTDPPVTSQELEMSVVVIKNLLMHFTKKTRLNKPPKGSISKDPEVAFTVTVLHRISDWRREERRWAEAIITSLGPSCLLLNQHPPGVM